MCHLLAKRQIKSRSAYPIKLIDKRCLYTSVQANVTSSSANDLNLNLNSLLVKRQNDNPSPGAVTGGNLSLALTREVN